MPLTPDPTDELNNPDSKDAIYYNPRALCTTALVGTYIIVGDLKLKTGSFKTSGFLTANTHHKLESWYISYASKSGRKL
jgi:hypothetical protein